VLTINLFVYSDAVLIMELMMICKALHCMKQLHISWN